MGVLIVAGTRPEVIKLAPVIAALTVAGETPTLCVTGQHRELLDQALVSFDLAPAYDLDLMGKVASLDGMAAAITERVAWVIAAERPDWVVVQGDTTTAYATSLAASRCGARLAHVEAGLRTGDLAAPWPEEGHRRGIAQLAQLHFAPTSGAAANLVAEGVEPADIDITGNTAIDALCGMCKRLDSDAALFGCAERELATLPRAGKRVILVTGHRRESHGVALLRVAAAMRTIAARGDVEVVLAAHPAPAVRDFTAALASSPGITVLPSLSYSACVLLLRRAALAVTDSGGLQEEAPALCVPVLVTRRSTERPEAIDAGAALLVGTGEGRIVAEVTRLLDDPAHHAAMAQARFPFGDGNAGRRIAARLMQAGPRAAKSARELTLAL